ncbi:MAG: hypothetical protein K2N52_02210 [Clostridia bacterium]|nr:hypothetical protein [Clostridia bacterium]
MKATGWDLMKLAQAFDGEFCLSDFTPEELDGLLCLLDDNMTVDEVREKYFEFYDDIKDRTLNKHRWSD